MTTTIGTLAEKVNADTAEAIAHAKGLHRSLRNQHRYFRAYGGIGKTIAHNFLLRAREIHVQVKGMGETIATYNKIIELCEGWKKEGK